MRTTVQCQLCIQQVLACGCRAAKQGQQRVYQEMDDCAVSALHPASELACGCRAAKQGQQRVYQEV